MSEGFPRATAPTETLRIRLGALYAFFELTATQRNEVMDSSELLLRRTVPAEAPH